MAAITASASGADLFYDDFDGPALDRSRWNVEVTGPVVNHEQQAYVDAPDILYLRPEWAGARGALILQPRYRPGYATPEGRTFDLLSARLNTRRRFEFTYGAIAARIWLPAAAGVWPAFWALGAAGEWPACGEIDVMEYVGEADWVSAALHGPGYSGETPLVNKKFLAPAADAARWHIYSAEWRPDGLTFAVDGELYYRVTRPMVEFYGPWVFDQPHFLILNLALGGVYPFKTNGQRAPYYGLPAATLQAIQQAALQMAVDWVRVTPL